MEKYRKFLLKTTICLIVLFLIVLVKNHSFANSEKENAKQNQFCYLSDIKYIPEKSSVGWGSITLDKNLDSSKNSGLITLIIDGKKTKFLKGISAHATSTVVYDIRNYDYDYFTTYLGVDEGRGNDGNGVKFVIYTSVDGENWDVRTEVSPPVMKGTSNALFYKIDIKGQNYIKLYAHNNGNDTADHAVYANAKLIKEGYEETTTSANFIKTIEEYDNLIKTHYGEEIKGDYELLLLQRELVNCVGYDMLQLYAALSEQHLETLSWLFNDLENLRLYIMGGKPDIGRTFDPTTQKGVNANENYLQSLNVLNELYQACKEDFDIKETTKYGTVLGDLYKRMAITLSLTHSKTVGLWMQSNKVENQSNAVTRYNIYKKMHKDGKFVVTENIDITKWFEEYTIEEMRFVLGNAIDDEEILWLNEYTQSYINKAPNEAWKYLTPHPYMAYTPANYNNPIFHDPNRKDYWDEKFGGIFSKYGVSYSTETNKIQKVWMNLRNEFGTGAVCGGISKTGANIRSVHGIAASVISQPGHAAIIYYAKNNEGQGYWSIDNDVSGWAQSGRTENLNNRMPLGWGNEEYIHFHQDWLGMATYVILAQGALNDYDNYQVSRETLILADVYRDDLEKLNEIYRDVVEAQPLNIDGWYGLIKTYRQDNTKTEADFSDLSKEIMENLKYYPLPMYHLVREAKKNIASPEHEFVYTLDLARALTAGKNATNAQTLQWQATRTEANHLLGLNDTTLASFSFDGEDSGKIVLSSRFDGNGIRWDYSLDGKQTWNEVSFLANEEHKLQLTEEQIKSITSENDIYVHIVGVGYEENNLYKIDIKDSAGLPNSLYANDLENRLIGATPALQWKYREEDEWTSYSVAEPDLTGDKSVIVRVGATGTYLASTNSKTYYFTQDNQPDTRKYIPVSHLSIQAVSTQATSQGRPATNAIDANPNTNWHSAWDGSDRQKFITIELDEPKNLNALEYFPVAGGNGKIESAQILVSMDGQNWREVVSGTDWRYSNGNDISMKSVEFEPTRAKYIKIVGKKTQAASASNSFIAAALFNLYEDTTVKVVGSFSFDGNNGRKIILEEEYKTLNWKYSLDSGDTWKEGRGEIQELTTEEISQINENDKIKIKFEGNDKEYTINIKKGVTPTITVYLNDLENRLIGVNNKETLEWMLADGNSWTDFSEKEPVVEGNKTLLVRAKSTGICVASDSIEYQFTEDNQPDTRKYIPISRLSIAGFSAEDKGVNGSAVNAIDGNYNSRWLNSAAGTDTEKYIVIEFDKPVYLSAIDYVPHSENGKILRGKILGSVDGENFTEIKEVNWANNEETKTTEFEEAVKVKYVKIIGEETSYVSQKRHIGARMFNFYEDITKNEPEVVIPTAEVEYNITELTNQDVIATLVNPSTEITVTNNNGSTTYTFTENGEFTFEFVDKAGNAGSATAKVSWIDKKDTEEFIFNSEKYKIGNGFISEIRPRLDENEGTSVNEFKQNINTNQKLTFLDLEGNELNEEDFIRTGFRLIVGDSLEYTLIVKGDIDGDGAITVNDLAKMKLHCIEKSILEGNALKAAQVDGDELVTVNDLATLKLLLLGLKSIN